MMMTTTLTKLHLWLLMLCCLGPRGDSLQVLKRPQDFPLHDCLSEDIDLLFVADAAVDEREYEALRTLRQPNDERLRGTAHTNFTNITDPSSAPDDTEDATSGGYPESSGDLVSGVSSESYRIQMRLFSAILDIFTGPWESELTRVRVALAVSVGESDTLPLSDHVRQRFNFTTYNSKSEAIEALLRDSTAPTRASYPFRAAEQVMAELENGAMGVRKDAQRVVIIVADHHINLGSHPYMSNATAQAFASSGIKIMYVVANNIYYYLMRAVFPENTLLVSSLSSDPFWNHNIPMALCSACMGDWINYRSSGKSITHSSASCYRLSTRQEKINWLDAYGMCRAYPSDIVSIETKEELLNLRQKLPTKIHKLIKDNGGVDYSDEAGFHVDIFIGLRREDREFKKHFRWDKGPPLVYSNWARGEPSGGYSKACVVWRFNLDTKGKLIINVTQSGRTEDDFVALDKATIASDAWYTVPCGHRSAKMYICEILPSLYGNNFDIEDKIIMTTTGSPSWSSVHAAIDRGELGIEAETDKVGFLLSASVMLEMEASGNTNRALLTTKVYDANVTLDPSMLFSCGDNQLIAYSFVCDNKPDCNNKYDESICLYPSCSSASMYECFSGQCLPKEAKCDLFTDCHDGSDEVKCLSCDHGLCPDGSCLPKHWFADDEVDCAGNTFSSVEEEIASTLDDKIGDCVLICNRTQCVSPAMMGDGVVDCQGPEGPLDETIGKLEATTCHVNHGNSSVRYRNWAPRCVYVKDRYGGVTGCSNMAHLQDCQNFTCAPGYVKCPESYCIPMHYVRNGVIDCQHGEDEITSPLACLGYFKCTESRVCLHPDNICDNHPHCPKGDDELNCNVSCKDGFLCVGGAIAPIDYDRTEPLTDLSFIDERTRYLDLSGIQLSRTFPIVTRNRLQHLVAINFSDCGIENIECLSPSSCDLRSVAWLDMSRNLIKEIPAKNLFREMNNLRTLNLSRNYNLERVHDYAFDMRGQSQIKELDLSFTSISCLSYMHLAYLKRLTHLFLQGTKIANLESAMFPKDYCLEVLDLRSIPLKSFHPETFKNVTILSTLYTDNFELCCPQIHNSETKSGTCQAPKDAFSSCSDLMHEVILRLLLWVNGSLAIVGNLVVIVYRLFYDQTVLHMAYGHFVTHLGIADLIMGVYLLIIAAADAHYRGTYVWNEMSWRNSILCKLAGFSSTLASETSALFIFLITVDRFLVVKFPFGQFRMSNWVMKFCCSVVWLIGLTIALIPLLPSLAHWGTYTSNGMCLGLHLMNTRQPGWQFSAAVFIAFNFFLFILISLGQLLIYRAMTKVSMDTGLQSLHHRRIHDFTIARNLSLIAITDFLCWFPIGVTGLVALHGIDVGVDTYAWLVVLVLPFNSAINPLIYTIPALKRRWRERRDNPPAPNSSGNSKK